VEWLCGHVVLSYGPRKIVSLKQVDVKCGDSNQVPCDVGRNVMHMSQPTEGRLWDPCMPCHMELYDSRLIPLSGKKAQQMAPKVGCQGVPLMRHICHVYCTQRI